MNRRLENQKRLAEWGLAVEEEPGQQPDPVIETDEPSSEIDEPGPAPEPAPEPEPEKQKSPDGHDWEKRKADAQEAQRQLSRKERDLEKKEREIDAKLAELDRKMQDLERLAALKQAPPSDPERDSEILDPDVESEARRLARQEYERAKREEAKAEEEKRKAREKEEADRQSILDAVFEARPDAAEVASSQEFNDWLDALPARLSAKYRDYIERTTLYSAEDALAVFDLFDEAKPKKPKPRQPEANVEIPPSGQTNAAPSKTAVRALTPQEMAQINSLIRNSRTQEERDLWSKRLRFTFENPAER